MENVLSSHPKILTVYARVYYTKVGVDGQAAVGCYRKQVYKWVLSVPCQCHGIK